MAQLSSCSSSQSLLSSLHGSNLCPATPDWWLCCVGWEALQEQTVHADAGAEQCSLSWAEAATALGRISHSFGASFCFPLPPCHCYGESHMNCTSSPATAVLWLLCSAKGAALSSSVPASSRVDLEEEGGVQEVAWGWNSGNSGWMGRAGAAGRGSSVGCHSQGCGFAGSVTVGLAVPGCCSAAGKADFTPQWFLTLWWTSAFSVFAFSVCTRALTYGVPPCRVSVSSLAGLLSWL